MVVDGDEGGRREEELGRGRRGRTRPTRARLPSLCPVIDATIIGGTAGLTQLSTSLCGTYSPPFIAMAELVSGGNKSTTPRTHINFVRIYAVPAWTGAASSTSLNLDLIARDSFELFRACA